MTPLERMKEMAAEESSRANKVAGIDGRNAFGRKTFSGDAAKIDEVNARRVKVLRLSKMGKTPGEIVHELKINLSVVKSDRSHLITIGLLPRPRIRQ